MAFVTQKSGENPLQGVDDGIYPFVVVGWAEVENRWKGQLYNKDAPEGENNRRNTYDTQYEATIDIDVDGETVQAKVWANPTTGERSKLRRIAKALGVWESREVDGELVEGFDDDPENLVGREGQVVVEDGKVSNLLKAR